MRPGLIRAREWTVSLRLTLTRACGREIRAIDTCALAHVSSKLEYEPSTRHGRCFN
jgi:hypothetical protein